MTPEQIAARYFNVDAAALRAVRIKDGLTNESYRVTGGHENIVVRISNRDDASLQINRHSEAAVLDLVEQAGIGAPVLFNQPGQHILITRELPGSNPAAQTMADKDNIERVAALLCRLHTLEVNKTVRSMQLAETLQQYWRLLGDWHDRDQAMRIAHESDGQRFRALCHNDVHHLNLIDDGRQLWLLDWEYAGIGDPYFDLASVCCYHDFTGAQRLMLLESYASIKVMSSLPSLEKNSEKGRESARDAGFCTLSLTLPHQGGGNRIVSSIKGSTEQVADVERLQRMCWLFDYIRELWFAVRNAEDIR